MLGRSTVGAIDLAESITVTSTTLARSTAVPTEATSRTVLLIRLGLSLVWQTRTLSRVTIPSRTYRIQ
jgi:hypothetical protein